MAVTPTSLCKHPFALFAAGALMSLAFAPYHAWPVLCISLPIFYRQLIASISLRQAMWRGFLFGYGYFMAGTWWIGNALLVDAEKFAWLLPFSILGLSAIMAWSFALLGGTSYALRRWMNPLLFAALWVLAEYARSFGMLGFPWNLAGYAALASLNFSQAASIIGTYGLSFVVVSIGVAPVWWFTAGTARQRIGVAMAAIAVLTLGLFYGAARLKAPVTQSAIIVRLVQPSIPQAIKSSKEGRDLALEVLGALSRKPSASGKTPDVTIWPETVYPYIVRSGDHLPTPATSTLITGTLRWAEGGIANSLVAVGVDGRLLASYDKHQLVPFGEFVPLRSVLPLEKITPGSADFSRGKGPQTVVVKKLPPFSPLVCYEAIFPVMAVAKSLRPAWLINVTNDAWYGDTAGPHQHFAMARMRAIEQGLPLARVANNGVSALVDGRGVILAQLPLNARDILDLPLPVAEKPTIYSVYGEFLTLILLLLTMAFSVFHRFFSPISK